jgi:photosystem II stability/assembly factor-like uncharacterized protein
MKKITTLIIFILLSFTSSAQWVRESPPTNNTLYKVRLISPFIGWTVSDSGTILKTTDGGISWQTQSSGTTNGLYSTSFTDANNGTVVGKGGTILRTTNGGTSWQTQSSGTTNILMDVSFTDSNNGTIVGYSGTILHTTNGGTSWLTQSSEATGNLYGVSFSDLNNGFVVGYGWNGTVNGGIIMRTTNGGANWNAQTSGTTWSLRGIAFIDSNTAIAVGGGGYGGNHQTNIILRTTNGGTTWILQFNLYDVALGIFEDVSFCDTKNGATVNERSPGGIWRTTDGGITWESQSPPWPPNYQFLSISFSDANNGIAVGGGGTIFRTTNGGVTFIKNDNNAIQEFTLSQNYPNPFNPSTIISYTLPSASKIKLILYNTLGQTIKVLENGFKNAGSYSVNFNADDLPSGIYFYKLEAGQFSQVKKMILMK